MGAPVEEKVSTAWHSTRRANDAHGAPSHVDDGPAGIPVDGNDFLGVNLAQLRDREVTDFERVQIRMLEHVGTVHFGTSRKACTRNAPILTGAANRELA
jgi:hypothetical protein